MKKLISLILVLVMVMGLSVTVFAADQTGVGTGNYTADVTGTYEPGTTGSGTVYSVDIAWAGMSFTYYAEKAPVWDAEKHQYSPAEPARWEGEGTITVTNHSNAVIKALPSYTAETDYTDAKMEFDFSGGHHRVGLYLDTAAANNQATSNTITVTPSGTLPSTASNTKIGTIQVSISDAEMDLSDPTNLENHESMWRSYMTRAAAAMEYFDGSAVSAAHSTLHPLMEKCLNGDSDADYAATATALVNYYNAVSQLLALEENAG